MKSKVLKTKDTNRLLILFWIIILILSVILLIDNISFLYKEFSTSFSNTKVEESNLSWSMKTNNKEIDNNSTIIISEEEYNNILKENEEMKAEKVEEENKAMNKNNEENVMMFSQLHSDIPILNYASDELGGNSYNFLLENLAKIFPINQYVVDAARVSNDGLFNNQGTVSDILGIIENIRSDRRVLGGKVKNVDNSESIQVDVIEGDVQELEGEETAKEIDTQEVIGQANGEYFTLEQLLDRTFLYSNFYIIDSSTAVNDKIFDAKVLLEKDLSLDKDQSKPQILIYHTHSQEAYSDSRPGEEEDTVVGVGAKLAGILSEYGYNVIHDKTQYDLMGKRNLAYNYANNGISKILEENPSIEVTIDVHRDSGNKRVTTINNSETAKVMLFNGISTNAKGEPIDYLPNPNLQGNLAFSLQLQLKGREAYPGFLVKNYLKSLRYNLHHRERSLLIEVGTVNNTIGEAKNAMTYFAALINDVLTNAS